MIQISETTSNRFQKEFLKTRDKKYSNFSYWISEAMKNKLEYPCIYVSSLTSMQVFEEVKEISNKFYVHGGFNFGSTINYLLNNGYKLAPGKKVFVLVSKE